MRGNKDNCIKNSLVMSNAFVFYLRGKIMEISCACVCVSFTSHSVPFLLVFHPAHVSACSGVIGSVCVPSCKDDGVWLVKMARPKFCHVRGLTCRI